MSNNLQTDSKQVSKQTQKTVSSEDPAFQITFNYELIDDAYCIFEDDDRSDDKSMATQHDNDSDDFSINMNYK